MTINEQLAELEDKLNLQDSKITGLKENVKWLYKYGGSGTGSGSGGGSSSTKTPALVYSSSTGNMSVELGSTSSNTYIATEGTQNLSFFLRYLNTDHAYKVSYSTNDGTSWTTITVSDTNDFIIPLTIQGNINVQVRLQDITDNSAGPAKLILGFITNPITITPYLIGENANGQATVSGEIFMQNYTKIWAVIDVTPHLTGSFTATSDSLPEDFILTDIEVDKTYQSKQLLYDKDFLSDPTNVGAYSLKYSTEFTNDVSGIQTNEFEQAYTLIPNSTYAIIKTEEGSIYTTKKDSSYYEFSAGSITFIGYIYKGSNDGETFQKVVAEVYDDQGSKLHTFPVSVPVTERDNFLSGTTGTFYFNNDYISNSNGNWFEIRVTIAQTADDEPQVQSYYIFVKKNSNVLNWYPSTIAGDWYFNKENKSKIDGITDSTSEISCQLSIDPQSYSWTNDLTVNTPETQIAIAINAEEGNDDVLLASLQSTTNSTIDIYQNKIQLANYGEIEIYVPMDNQYHLLQLYGRIVDMEDANTPKYEWVAYIDGIIEGALASYTKANISLKGFTLNPESKGVFTVNHFNYTVFDCGTYKRWDNGYLGMNDSNVTEYFYKYKCATNTSYKEGDYAAIIQAFNAIKYTYDSGTHKQQYLTKLTASSVATIQSYGGLPVLVFQVKQTGLTNILQQMETSYGEEDEPGAIQLEDIKYYKAGNTEAEACDSSLASSDYYYTIEIQGSSTKGYKFKNWELGINSSQTEVIPIFSLDYNEDEGFFPEQSFTLKGDIVDSSHCVNTSIGAFVNANTTPFNVGYQNCLSGKPLLVIVENVPDGSAASEFYFLGIYNYNLGRKSKYNLNYAERPSLESGLDGFVVRTTRSTSTKSTYASAEIANNSCFWDFSQYDSSILFENQYKMEDGSDPTSDFLATHDDTYYMWGDLVYSQGFDINKKVQNCVKGVSRAGGFLFDTFLKKEFDSDAYFTELTESSSSKAYKVINHVPDSKHSYIRKVKYNSTSNSYSYIFEPNSSSEANYTQLDLTDCIYGRKDADGNITQQPYINYNSVMEYYVVMQAFGLVDSPMKNLNIKTWNGDTFYAAFYDMDTGLGGDNGGSITITPFAFSDYWETNESGIVTRHLDYWPQSTTETGFDVPSSFLFAIGKYAAYYQQAHTEIGDKLLSPMEYWAKLRQADGNLRNAEYFVNTYFNNHFTNTHPILWNMNYRSKYLIQDDGSYNTTQFAKFHGRRLNRTKAWLSDRLHMLDAYFNVNNLAYSAENNKETSLKISSPDSSVSTLSKNSDVILLQNIFTSSGTDSIKTDQNINCTVETLDYSPFIAQSTNSTSSVRLFNSGNKYNVSIAVTGNQSIYPYGCSRWTYMDSINSFIQNDVTFYIKNNYLTNLNCDKNYTSTFSPSSWELHTPKMQKISITGSSFKNSLLVYPGTALTDLDLSNTSITFETQATGSYNVCPNLKNVILKNFKGSISLNNCNLLNSLVVDNAVLNSLEINPYKGNCSFSNTQIKSLKIIAISENATFSLTNDTAINSIELSGFKSVSINGCKNLKKITLTGTLPETLKVDSCLGGITFPNLIDSNGNITFTGVKELSFNTTKFDTTVKKLIGTSDLVSIDGGCEYSSRYGDSSVTFDLSACNNLSNVNFTCGYANSIIFGNVNITGHIFMNSTIRSITGKLTIIYSGGYTFYGCQQLTTLGDITFSSSVTSLAYTFHDCRSLTNIKSMTILGSITNIESMCAGVGLTSSTVIARAIGTKATSVTNMKGCFEASQVKDFSEFLKLSWDGITSRNAMIGACNTAASSITSTITKANLTFKNASTVDPLCLFQTSNRTTYWNYTREIPFDVNSLNGTLTTSLDFTQIVVKNITHTDFLNNATACTSVSNLEFVKDTNLTFGDNTHILKFTNCIQNNTVNTESVNNFFKYCDCITSSLNALVLTNDLEVASFVDYSKLKTSTTLFSSDFNITKQITQEEFAALVNTIFDSTDNNLTSVQGVFKNCTITCDESCYDSRTLEISIPANSNITDISSLFENCHAFYTDEEENKVKIYLKFTSNGIEGFSNLPNLKKCSCAWKDCYLNKLTENWFANTSKVLSNCEQAFEFAQFYQRYSDDTSDKIAYEVNQEIALDNQVTTSESARTYTQLNCAVDEDFYEPSGHYIIPKKFFYYNDNGTLTNKVSSQFNGNQIFQGSNLYGLLPEQLFVTNERPSSNCSQMFRYCTIIPYYVTSKYQTLIPSTWSYSIGETKTKETLQNTTFKIDVYCVVPNGTETDPYLTGAMGDTLVGALIIPTIHQNPSVNVPWKDIYSSLTENSKDYINLDLTPVADADTTEADISIRTIDFIYQYNQYSLDRTQYNLSGLLPTSIGITQDYLDKFDSINWIGRYGSNSYYAWDMLTEYSTYGMNGYKLTWAYNYSPTTIKDSSNSGIAGSDEAFKIHLGVQYNEGDNLLYADDTNTDGLISTSKTKIDATGLINDKNGLLLYGPIFNKDLKVITNIADNEVCSNIISCAWGNSAGTPYGGQTTDSSASGYRYYHTTSNTTTLYAYDLSRNLIFPASVNNTTSIQNIVKGDTWTTTTAAKTRYTVIRYYNRRGIGNYNNNVTLYS